MADISYPVPLIPQPDKMSCWCASMAMILSFRKSASYPPEQLANDVGLSLRTSYGWDTLEAVKANVGFLDIPMPTDASLYSTPQQWSDWLSAYGPLWITVTGDPSHAIVVTGISGDMTPGGTTLSVNNPWDTTTTFSDDEVDFVPTNNGVTYQQAFLSLAADWGDLDLPMANWRILYLPPTQ